MFEEDENRRSERPRRQTEADLVAAARPRCDGCGDDTPKLFVVCVAVTGLARGRRICDLCIGVQGFTGWAEAAGSSPVRDPLGRATPPELETEPPTDWHEIAAALEGRLRRAS